MESRPMNFDDLRRANRERAAHWVEPGAEQPGLLFSAIELGGEAGETLNKVKKLERFRLGMAGGEDCLEATAEEIADVVICADLLAIKLDLDLAAIVQSKFNKTSAKHGFPTRL